MTRSPDPLNYATADTGRVAGIAGPVVVLVGGLALVVLGGSFLIGALVLLTSFQSVPGPFQSPAVHQPWAFRDTVFMTVMYLLAFTCFGAAAWVIVLSIRRLLAR